MLMNFPIGKTSWFKNFDERLERLVLQSQSSLINRETLILTQVLRLGQKNRHIASTKLNQLSSRR